MERYDLVWDGMGATERSRALTKSAGATSWSARKRACAPAGDGGSASRSRTSRSFLYVLNRNSGNSNPCTTRAG